MEGEEDVHICIYTTDISMCVCIRSGSQSFNGGYIGTHSQGNSVLRNMPSPHKKTSCTFKMCRKHVQEACFRHITKVIAKLTTPFLSYENMFRGTCQKRRCNACILLTPGLQGVEAIL